MASLYMLALLTLHLPVYYQQMSSCLTPFLHYCAHMEILARKLEARAENQKLNNHVQK